MNENDVRRVLSEKKEGEYCQRKKKALTLKQAESFTMLSMT